MLHSTAGRRIVCCPDSAISYDTLRRPWQDWCPLNILSTFDICSKQELPLNLRYVWKHEEQIFPSKPRKQSSSKTEAALGGYKLGRTVRHQAGQRRHKLTYSFGALGACTGGSKNISACPRRASTSLLRSFRLLDVRYMRAQPLNYQHTHLWMGSQLATLNAQLQNGQNMLPVALSGGPARLGSGLLSIPDQETLNKAVEVLVEMDQEAIVAQVGMYCRVLKACSKRKAIAQVKRVHAHLIKYGLENSKYIGECLVNALVKCRSFEEALELFQRLQHRTSISWTAVISGYVSAGQSQDALRMYQTMQREGVPPGKHTFVSLLKACGSIAVLEEGQRIHAEAIKHRYEFDLVVATSLVHMYAKCGSIMDAQHIFDNLSERDVVLWNAMLAGYAQQGQGEKALQLYVQMHEQGVAANDRTFVSMFQACGSVGEPESYTFVNNQSLRSATLQIGKVMHAEARRGGYELDLFVGNALISMYGKCGSIVDAQIVYDLMGQRDVVSCTAMLMACVQQGQPEKALQVYTEMIENCVGQNDRTFVFALQACVSLAENEECIMLGGQSLKVDSLQRGRIVHAEVQRRGYQSDRFVSGSLLSLYGKCGSTLDAQNVFDGLLQQDVVLWNAMLASYAQQGQAEKTLEHYGRMMEEGVSPDDRTFVSTVQACSMLAEKEEHAIADGFLTNFETLQKGKALHAEAWRRGHNADLFVGNALVSMYGKCKNIVDAEAIFNGLPQGDLVSWNAMLMGYTLQGQGQRTLELYGQMLAEGVSPDDSTYLCVLQACGSTGAMDLCTQIHHHLLSANISLSHNVANTLISGYGKCGRMEDAQEVFDGLRQPDVVSFNALLAGYAREGNVGASVQCFEKMRMEGVTPSGLTFLSLLSACSHAGMVDKGVQYFESMSKDYGLAPEITHYVTMVDLLGRAGHFTMVQNLLMEMQVPPSRSMWMCLLNACRKHCNVVLGRLAFDGVVALHPQDASPYAVMSHIYSQAGMQDSAKEVDELRKMAGASKMAGQSWIEHEQEVSTFIAGDCQQQQAQIYVLLSEIRWYLESYDLQ